MHLLTARHRVARSAAPDSRLLEVCAAIGYWVDYHKRQKCDWPVKVSKADTKAGILARRVGRHFESFVGDADKWSRLLWKRYDELRHDPDIQHDRQEVRLLVESARVLLTAALLNEVARDDAPSQSLCKATDNYMLGYEIRRDVTDTRAYAAPTDDSIFDVESE